MSALCQCADSQMQTSVSLFCTPSLARQLRTAPICFYHLQMQVRVKMCVGSYPYPLPVDITEFGLCSLPSPVGTTDVLVACRPPSAFSCGYNYTVVAVTRQPLSLFVWLCVGCLSPFFCRYI